MAVLKADILFLVLNTFFPKGRLMDDRCHGNDRYPTSCYGYKQQQNVFVMVYKENMCRQRKTARQ
jgi:hypothetical protein